MEQRLENSVDLGAGCYQGAGGLYVFDNRFCEATKAGSLMGHFPSKEIPAMIFSKYTSTVTINMNEMGYALKNAFLYLGRPSDS